MRPLAGFFAALAFLTFVPHTHAQALGAEPLTISISPQNPQPYQSVTVTPQSTLFDLNASTVTISLNGTVLQKGSGSQPVSFVTGPVGETDTITVSASSPAGNYEKTVVVRPASVALVLEPVSTTHPFYGGGALIASEGRVRLIAIPEFRDAKGPLASAGLVYTWKAGDRIMLDQSGIGRSILTALAPIRYRDTDVSVTVSTPDDSIIGQASVTLSATDPLLTIYRDDPLSGPDFDTALTGNFTMGGNEEAFRAVPYFFSGTQALAWSVNGAVSGSDPVITVRTTGDSAGTANLSVTASESNALQSADAALPVHFGGTKNSTSIFGL